MSKARTAQAIAAEARTLRKKAERLRAALADALSFIERGIDDDEDEGGIYVDWTWRKHTIASAEAALKEPTNGK